MIFSLQTMRFNGPPDLCHKERECIKDESLSTLPMNNCFMEKKSKSSSLSNSLESRTSADFGDGIHLNFVSKITKLSLELVNWKARKLSVS